MRVYLSVLKLRMNIGLQYRTAALAGVATQFFWGFITIMVFEAFYEYAANTPPISLKELITYIWLQQAFLVFITMWFRDNELFDLITMIPFGSVNYLPLLYILGKNSGNEIYSILTPIAGSLFILPCLLFWQYGVKHYRSTGS